MASELTSASQPVRGVDSGSQLGLVDHSQAHTFVIPAKKIHNGQDVTDFLNSKAYQKIMTFLFQLNGAMFPRFVGEKEGSDRNVQIWELGSKDVAFSEPVLQLGTLLQKLEVIVDEFPPDPGPRRFGNVSFRRWSEAISQRLPALLAEHLPAEVLGFSGNTAEGVSVQDEISAYLLGSFGSAQRLDYGTGHELSFLAFLGCLWMLGGFSKADPGVEERGIVLGVIEPYLHLIRRLIQTYTLEPAGSHGVWGLDDHAFLPYIFGSAQYGPPITTLDQLPTEGSYVGAPNPTDVAKANLVEKQRGRNMYFAAIGFIYDVKKGPFWEHSPILFDISGVKAGWAKINKGMIKMYNAEVLGKFPVVQHFPFGSLFSWERDPKAPPPTVPPKSNDSSTHKPNQPSKTPPLSRNPSALGVNQSSSLRSLPSASSTGVTRAPWPASGSSAAPPQTVGTTAPWAKIGAASVVPNPVSGATGAPWAKPDPAKPTGGADTEAALRAPWAT